MGCDIHTRAEKRDESGTWRKIDGLKPFDWRNYGLFGFLAGVRNYSDVTPLSEPRGFPHDASRKVKQDYAEWMSDAHSASWLTIEELLAFDYDAEMEDRRITVQLAPNHWHGGMTAEPGGGEMVTYRAFLGQHFFDDLAKLTNAGAERIVFWFDN